MTTAAPTGIWRRLAGFAAPYRWQLSGTLALTLLATPLALLTPVPLRIAVDAITGAAPQGWFRGLLSLIGISSVTGILVSAAVLLVFITLLVYVQALTSWIAQTWVGEKLVLDLRAVLFRHAQRLSLAYHDRTGTTDSVYRIQYDAESLQYVIVNGLMPLLSAAFTLIGMTIVTAGIDPLLAAVALTVCPILYFLTDRFGRRLRTKWFEVHQLDSSAMGVVQEVLSAVRVVKAFGQEEQEQQRFIHRSSARFFGQMHLARLQGKLDIAVGVTMACGTATVLLVGAMHVRTGQITLGQLLMVMAYLAQMYEPLRTMSKKVADVQKGLSSAQRALSLLDQLPDVEERENARPLHRAHGRFRFEGTRFAYETARPILRSVDLEIAAGSRVGIEGRTGSGKTTFISLLTRFYDPSEGRILLDGVDIRDYRLADLRNQFAIVLQDPILFSTSIAENIAYGRPGASESEIVEAARAANVHEAILQLPDGYRTAVGERGMRLSGGERQRISIARAFLKDAPILLLDEPTSAVDASTEGSIIDAIERLMRGRTVFMIAHRLSTLEACDIRLRMVDGRMELKTTLEQELTQSQTQEVAFDETRA